MRLSGIRNTTTVFDKPERDRVRLVSSSYLFHAICPLYHHVRSQDTSHRMAFWWQVTFLNIASHTLSSVYQSFSAREALGQYWMKDLDNGAYRKEAYVAHIGMLVFFLLSTTDWVIDSPGSDNVILLTSTRVLSFWSKKLRLDWDLPLAMVQGVAVEDTGIRFTHKSGKELDKFVFIPDKTSQAWFFGQIASVVKAFNNRRRMDS